MTILKAGITGGRETLTANRTYYVRTDGSDSNTGLVDSAGGAFLTIQKGIDVAAALDAAIYNVTVQIRNGTYTGTNTLKSFVGSGYMEINGDTATPANVIISVTGDNCFTMGTGEGIFYLRGFRLQTTTAGHGIVNNSSRGILWFDNIDFGAVPAGHAHLQLSASNTQATGNYSISGGAGYHINAGEGALINTAGRTVTLTGTPAFGSAFIQVANLAFALANSITFTGGATGPRFITSVNGVIQTNGGGASYFPGNAAGTEETVYDTYR